MSIHNPVTISGVDSDGSSEQVDVTSGAAHVASVGLAAQAHTRIVDNVTASVLGTILFPPGVFAYRVKIVQGTPAAGTIVKVVEDATPTDWLIISSVSKAAAAVITTSTDHNLQTGNPVTIRNVSGGSVDVNGQHTITVTGTATFTIAIDTSAATGTYINGNAIDLTQANTWLTNASADPDIDVQYSEFAERALTDNEGFSEWKQFDGSSEGVRRLDFEAHTAAGPFTITVETA